MKTEHRGWRVLALGSALAAVAAFGCGGGGGSRSASGAGTISGSLTKASGVRTASLSLRQQLMAAAGRWLGATAAIAQSATTTCGNPTEPAAAVTVNLIPKGGTTPIQSTTTNAEGEFAFTNVPPGDYVIQVTLANGTISAPVIVQPGQTTSLKGELDVDCEDVDHDGDRTEPAIHVEEDTEDGSHLEADETEDGGDFQGDVKQANGGAVHESGSQGDRSDEVDSEETSPNTSSTPTGTHD